MRIYNLPNEEIPNRFVGKQVGHNKESRFRSVLDVHFPNNKEVWTAYSFQMPIAIWDEDSVLMPLESSFFDLTVSKRTAQHMRDIYWRLQRSEVKVVCFIPSFGDTYEAGEGVSSINHGRGDIIDLKHLIIPLRDGYHLSKSFWKTERGAYQNAISMVSRYSNYINFKAMDVEEVDDDEWHVRLDYFALER